MRKIKLLTTGGTMEKTYDELSGALVNQHSIVGKMLQRLRLEDTKVNVLEVMSKDSLDITDADRDRIVDIVRAFADPSESSSSPDLDREWLGVVILHGTDTLEKTGQRIFERIPKPQVPIVLSGAMRPFEMKKSDSLQNLTEAIFAAGMLPPGVYCVAHGRALPFPGVRKDRTRGTFVRDPDPSENL